MAGPARYTIRPVEPGDLQQINQILNQVWFAQRSVAGFDWLCIRNPGQSGLAAGWVVDDGSGVQAFLGNFVQRAWRNGEPFMIASGHNFVANWGRGGSALGLIRTFLRQEEPVILSGMNSNPVSAELYHAMRLHVYPDNASLKLSWITNPAIAAMGALSWRAHSVVAHHHARRFKDIARSAPDVDRIVVRQKADVVRIKSPLKDGRLAEFDASLRAGPRLFTERSPEAMAWRLADPDTVVEPVLLAWPASGSIRGIALFQFNKPSEAEPPQLDVVDLVTLDPADGAAAQALMAAGLSLARGGGAARLRLSLAHSGLLRLLGPFAASARRSIGIAPHAFFKANAAAPEPIEAAWQPLPYDGDNGPSLRPMPILS